MSEKLNRRDEIVQAATELFIKDGYTATSVRDIAQRVGCTEAALYYHFKDGKRGLFKEVVESILPLLLGIIEGCRGRETLAQFVECFAEHIRNSMTSQAPRFRWITSEFPNFGEEERAIVHQKHIAIYEGMTALIRPFIPDEEAAHQSAWIILCTTVGYMQLFCTLDLKSDLSVKQVRLVDLLTRALSLELTPSE